MIPCRSACALLTLLGCAGAALQAQATEVGFISKIDGKGASLSRGDGKVPAKLQALVEAGDRVGAAAGSFVDVTYLSDGCIVRAAGGKSVVISETSPCAVKADRQASLPVGQSAGSEQKVVPAAAEEETAQVTEFKGPLARANLGQGLVNVNNGMALKVGHAVYAGQSTSVTLFFIEPKCYYTVEPETYLEITDKAPCEEPAPAPKSSMGVAPAIGAVALLGGGLGVIVLLPKDDDDDNNGGGSVTPD